MDGKLTILISNLNRLIQVYKTQCLDYNTNIIIQIFIIFSTCACGKWICTSKLCGSYQLNAPSMYTDKNQDEEDKQYEDMDNQID